MSEESVFCNFEVTAESHTLAAYRARGGYQALQKALTTLLPKDVEHEVTVSGLRGRGGATRRHADEMTRRGQPATRVPPREPGAAAF